MSEIIAFSGTHGTGKTTQTYLLAAKMKLDGKNVCTLDEVARECPYGINQKASWAAEEWILSTQINKELYLTKIYPNVITDRTVIDTLAYGLVLGLFNDNEKPFFARYAQNYSQIFLLDPVVFDYQKDDGIRDLDKDFRLSIHNKLVNLYLELGIKFIYVDDPNMNFNWEK